MTDVEINLSLNRGTSSLFTGAAGEGLRWLQACSLWKTLCRMTTDTLRYARLWLCGCQGGVLIFAYFGASVLASKASRRWKARRPKRLVKLPYEAFVPYPPPWPCIINILRDLDK